MIQFKANRVDNGEEVRGWYIKYQKDSFITNFANRNSFIGGFEKVHPESVRQIGFEGGVVSKLVGALKELNLKFASMGLKAIATAHGFQYMDSQYISQACDEVCTIVTKALDEFKATNQGE